MKSHFTKEINLSAGPIGTKGKSKFKIVELKKVCRAALVGEGTRGNKEVKADSDNGKGRAERVGGREGGRKKSKERKQEGGGVAKSSIRRKEVGGQARLKHLKKR